MNLDRLYNKWTYKQELNCELLLLFQFKVVTIHLDGSRKLKGEPRLISSVQSLSCVLFFATAWTAAHQASLSITNSRSSLRLTSIESVITSSHLILGHPLFLLPPIPPSIRVFSSESILPLRWPKEFQLASFLPKKSQGWSPSEWTGCISLQSKGLSRVSSNTTVQKH